RVPEAASAPAWSPARHSSLRASSLRLCPPPHSVVRDCRIATLVAAASAPRSVRRCRVYERAEAPVERASPRGWSCGPARLTRVGLCSALRIFAANQRDRLSTRARFLLRTPRSSTALLDARRQFLEGVEGLLFEVPAELGADLQLLGAAAAVVSGACRWWGVLCRTSDAAGGVCARYSPTRGSHVYRRVWPTARGGAENVHGEQ